MSYLKFIDLGIPKGQKTRRYSVQTDISYALGQVKFYGAWRKFCFFPAEHTIFDSGCLEDIAEFCRHQNDERRKES